MSAQVMRRERGELADDGVAEASEDRLREVLGGYPAYAGRYELEPAARTVTHRIECGLMPAHVGTELTTAHAPRTGGRVVWELIG